MMWTMFIVCLVAMSFLRSSISGGNDLGFRGILVVQFVLLIWAAPVVRELFSPGGGDGACGWRAPDQVLADFHAGARAGGQRLPGCCVAHLCAAG